MKLNEMKADLRTLSGLLSSWKNVRNPNVLQNISFQNAARQLNYGIADSTPLIFVNVDLDRHCIPLGIEKLHKDDLDISVKLTTACCEGDSDIENRDPIDSLGVNIVIEIIYKDDNGFNEANCSWHLDKGDPATANFSHPTYHMNFGGSYMTKQGDVFGKLLLLAAPRVIHPPMDIVLSCDFIIRNFYQKSSHKIITENPAYKNLLDKAKSRYWKPYSMAFSSNWYNELSINNLSGQSIFGH